MSSVCSRAILLCMIMILLILLYWMIRLDKFHDYKYVLREYWKWIKLVASDIQKKLGSSKSIYTDSSNQTKITVINLESNRELGQVLNYSDKKRKYSIRIEPTKNSLQRKNSIEQKIQFKSIQDRNLDNQQSLLFEQSQLQQPQQAQENILNLPSSNHFNHLFDTSLQVNTILPKRKNYQTLQEPITRGGLRKSSDFFKMYMQYEKRSKKELASTKNAKSNQNIEKRLSFTNLCEIDGVKTIRDLIKECV